MTKRRKKTNKNVPAKGRLKQMADDLWSLAIRDDWAYRCAVCSGGAKIEAHHIIPRQHQATRYTLNNGICLCATHHKFDADVSPHVNAPGFMFWLQMNHIERYQWVTDMIATGDHKRFYDTLNWRYYCDVIQQFRQYVPDDFERIVGVKFSRWLEEEYES